MAPKKIQTSKFHNLFQRAALIPLLAFIGLGADGLSSSSYGPEEAFLALHGHSYLILFVAAMTVFTIGLVSASYCQIMELFPKGGGGYVVASKLLSPKLGLLSGCALLVDYILTISISIASGVDALYSLIPPEEQHFKIEVKIIAVALLMILNLRGIRESIFPLIPVFFLFIFTHAFAFTWSFFHHADGFAEVIQHTTTEASSIIRSEGLMALFLLILRAYSMGAGTYTGIEAVSNGMNLIKEPAVPNAKRTMVYISTSLALTVVGLVFSYLLYKVAHEPGKTLNAILFNAIGDEIGGWWGASFAAVTLFSETALLFVAAETGFLGGPQVLSNMSRDQWFPHKFMGLSDRFVMHRGILLMGLAAAVVMLYTHGAVATLVVLYSLSVFVTFTLSQAGMVRHWWSQRYRNSKWFRKLLINGSGCLLTLFILLSLSILKFEQGAWLTILAVGFFYILGICIKRYYSYFFAVLSACSREIPPKSSLPHIPGREFGTQTIALMIGSVQGLSSHVITNVLTYFGDNVGHFVFLHVGLIDSGVFKGEDEMGALEKRITQDVDTLVSFMEQKGYSSEGMISVGLDIGDEIEKLAIRAAKAHPDIIFVGGQLVLPRENIVSHWLHNQTLFVIQRRIYSLGYRFVILPLYIRPHDVKLKKTIPAIWHA